MTRRLFAVWLSVAWLAAASAWGQPPKVVVVRGKALADIESLRDASGNPVKPWDFSPAQASINTEAIQRWADRLGAQDGTFDGLYVPGKAYAINDTIEDRDGYGSLVMYGVGGKSNSIPIDESAPGWTDEPGWIRYHLVSRFVWVGHPANGGQPYTDRPMFRLSGFGPVINGICFRGWHKNSPQRNPNRPEQMLHTAIELTKDVAWADPTRQIVGQYVFGSNSSKADFNGNSFIHCQRCYRSATPKLVKTVNDDGTPRSPEQYTEHDVPQHADTLYFGFNIADSCPCFYEIDNDQAVAHVGTYLKMTGRIFEPHCVVRAIHGGKVHFDSIIMVSEGTIFETHFVSSSNGDFSCDSLWWDASALAGDGAVSPWINFKGDSQFPLMASADPNSNVLKLPTTLKPIAGDVGKFLVITGGPNFIPGTYKITAINDSSPATYSWTLDDTISTTDPQGATNLQGYMGVVSYNRYVDMLEPRTTNFVISGHVPLEGANNPNMVRMLGPNAQCRLNVRQAHPAMARAYPMLTPVDRQRPFEPTDTNLRLFVDVDDALQSDGIVHDAYTKIHTEQNVAVTSVADASPLRGDPPANNDLSGSGSSRPVLVRRSINQKPALQFDGGDGLRKNAPSNLTDTSALSISGVLRVDSAVTGTDDTICGVWDAHPSVNQRCWRLSINSSQKLVLELSTNGSSNAATWTSVEPIKADRDTLFYVHWDGSDGTGVIRVGDGDAEPQNGGPTSPLHESTADFVVGASLSNNSFINGLTGNLAILMVDDAVLSGSAAGEQAYRFHEFTARRGTYLPFPSLPLVRGATNTAPIKITSLTHGLRTGDTVTITGVNGNTAANGTFTVTNINEDTFSLDGSTGSGNYTFGGSWSLVP